MTTTRELSPKTAAALIRKTFSEKGVSFSQTEALDLFSKLKGFNAWSHMQQATAKDALDEVAEVAEVTAVVKPKSTLLSLREELVRHYGLKGFHPLFWEEFRAFHLGTGIAYWDSVALKLEDVAEFGGYSEFLAPAPAEVTLPNGNPSTWQIEHNLSCRWGELNDHNAVEKPGLAILQLDEVLLHRLQEQMTDETTFIVRKSGTFGLLFEVEFCSQESESGNGRAAGTYKPHHVVVSALLEGLLGLEKQFPEIEFCIPAPKHVINDRPAVWGFCKLDSLTAERREELSNAVNNL